MTHTQFSDLEIRIFQCEDNGYPVEIQLDGQQQFPRGYLSADILPWRSSSDLSTDGRRLFETLFADATLRTAWDKLSGQAPQRRIRLWIDAQAPELHVIPWELLRESNILLATDPKTPFSRYLPCDIQHGEPVVERPIRVLAAISNPRDLDRYELVSLDVAEERQRLEAALGTLPDIQLDFLTSPVTLKQLEDHLHKGYHILHYIGHGAFSHRQREAALYLQDEAGNTNVVPAAQLCELLARQSQRPHLVFLSACQSATRDTTDAFRGLGPQLIAAEIPAVVAMQDQVSMVTARELGHTFYTRLLEHGVVDLALNEARGALVAQNRPDAAIPVLFMRLKDGRLFTPQVESLSQPPFMADDLPSDFVPRPAEFNALRDAILAEDHDAPTALRGAGGFGKTFLARELCHKLRDKFPDGVLWVTLGETPDETGGPLKLYDALMGERPAFFVDAEDVAHKLAEALGAKCCLMVIDDVWNAAHLRPFLRGGPNCTRLITTRNRNTLPPDVISVDVGAMRTNEAIALLGAGLSCAQEHTEALRALAARLGEWPLLLSLVNGVMRDRTELGQSLEAALAWVNRALDKRGLTFFDAQDAEARDQAVSLTMGVSLDLLDEDEQARYEELAVFPEDLDIPLTAIAVLWGATGGLESFETEELCEHLFDLSLIKQFDPETRKIQLHDVLRHYLIQQQEKRLNRLHDMLLGAYAVFCGHGKDGTVQWATVPSDEYIEEHLVYHLIRAERQDEVHQLFLKETWAKRRSRAGLISDFANAMYLISFEEDPSLFIRYIIFESVMQGMYEEMPVEILPAAMKFNLIRGELSETFVKGLHGDAVDRIQTYLDLLSYPEVQPTITHEIINLAAEINDPCNRATMVLQLIDIGIPEQLATSARRVVWKSTFEIDSRSERNQFLDSILPLSERELTQFCEDLLDPNIQDLVSRRLGGIFNLYRAVDIWEYVTRSCYLAMHYEEMWEILWQRAEESGRLGEKMGYIFPCLPENLKSKHLDEVWNMLQGLSEWESARYYPGVVKPLLPYVLDAHFSDVWRRIKIETSKDFEYKGYSLGLSLLHIPNEIVLDRLQYIKEQIDKLSISGVDFREEAVFYLWMNLAKHLTGEQRYQAYREGLTWATYSSSNKLLQLVTKRIDSRAAWNLWKQTIEDLYKDDLRGMDFAREHLKCKRLLSALAPKIPLEKMSSAEDDCLLLLSEHTPVRAVAPVLKSLCGRLSGSYLEDFWQKIIVRILAHESCAAHSTCIYATVELLEQIPLQIRRSISEIVLNAIEETRDTDKKLRYLAKIVNYLPSSMKPEIWLKAYTGAMENENVEVMYRTISQLININPQKMEEQRLLLENCDWEAEIWKSREWKHVLIKRFACRDCAQSLAIFLSYAPEEFRLRTWHLVEGNLEKIGFDFVIISLFPVIPLEEQEDILDFIIDKTGFDDYINILTTLMARWPQAFVWSMWKRLLDNLNVDNDIRYEPWLIALTRNLSADCAIQAWDLVIDNMCRGWYTGEAWEEIPILLVGKLPREELTWAYQKLAKFEKEVLHYDHKSKVPLVRRFTSEQLVAFFQRRIHAFPEDIFTCKLDKYIRYGGTWYTNQVDTYEFLNELHAEITPSEKQMQYIRSFAFFTSTMVYVLVPLFCVFDWIWNPFGWIGKTINSRLKRLNPYSARNMSTLQKLLSTFLFVVVLIPIQWTVGQLRKLSWMTKEVAYNFFHIMCSEQVLTCAAINQIIFTFAVSHRIAQCFAASKQEAVDILKKELSSMQGEARLRWLVRSRPLLQKIGGKDLRSHVQTSFKNACSWWQKAIEISQD